MSDQATETGSQDDSATQKSSAEKANEDQDQSEASSHDSDKQDRGTESPRQRDDDQTEGSDGQSDSSRQNGSSRGISAGEAIRSAREVIAELTGKQPEGISAINRSGEGGWTISLDVLELSRIPASTDLLATYEVSLDGDGSLVDMERTRRYTRNQVDED